MDAPLALGRFENTVTETKTSQISRPEMHPPPRARGVGARTRPSMATCLSMLASADFKSMKFRRRYCWRATETKELPGRSACKAMTRAWCSSATSPSGYRRISRHFSPRPSRRAALFHARIEATDQASEVAQDNPRPLLSSGHPLLSHFLSITYKIMAAISSGQGSRRSALQRLGSCGSRPLLLRARFAAA